jgi:GT2 family glycosyltransferase
MSTIAVLITCHNRKVQTIACLGRLFNQPLPQNNTLSVYLVDDGCTDGTAEVVREAYPATTILNGDGSLFWCNGMRLAWQHAAQGDPDFYLWLNDDTLLLPDCLAVLLAAWKEASGCGVNACIVVGSCCDPITAEFTYGGKKLLGHHPAKMNSIIPDSSSAIPCDTFNGNCVLVGRAAFRAVGIMRQFKHAISDTDYGLLAKRAGVRVVVAPGYVAECRANPEPGYWYSSTLSRRQRWQILLSRKGLPPGDWWKFLWAHAGLRALLYWPVPYVRVIVGL